MFLRGFADANRRCIENRCVKSSIGKFVLDVHAGQAVASIHNYLDEPFMLEHSGEASRHNCVGTFYGYNSCDCGRANKRTGNPTAH